MCLVYEKNIFKKKNWKSISTHSGLRYVTLSRLLAVNYTGKNIKCTPGRHMCLPLLAAEGYLSMSKYHSMHELESQIAWKLGLCKP